MFETSLSQGSNRFLFAAERLGAGVDVVVRPFLLRSEVCVGVCQRTTANEDLCLIEDRFLRKVGQAHQHAKSGSVCSVVKIAQIFF